MVLGDICAIFGAPNISNCQSMRIVLVNRLMRSEGCTDSNPVLWIFKCEQRKVFYINKSPALNVPRLLKKQQQQKRAKPVSSAKFRMLITGEQYFVHRLLLYCNDFTLGALFPRTVFWWWLYASACTTLWKKEFCNILKSYFSYTPRNID